MSWLWIVLDVEGFAVGAVEGPRDQAAARRAAQARYGGLVDHVQSLPDVEIAAEERAAARRFKRICGGNQAVRPGGPAVDGASSGTEGR